MPTYSYKCSNCNNRFSALKTFAERAEAECPECGMKAQKAPTASSDPLQVFVTGSKFHGIQTPKGLNEELEKRAEEHFCEEDAPKLREKYGSKVVEDMGIVKGDRFIRPGDKK